MFLVRCVAFLLLLAVGITVATSPLRLHAAEKCTFLQGSQATKEQPCEVEGPALFSKVSTWLADKIASGTAPDAKDIAALKLLVANAELWLRNAAGSTADAAPAELLIKQITTLKTTAETYPRKVVAKPEEIDPKATELIGALFRWIAGSKTPSSTAFAKGLKSYLDDAANGADAAFADGMPPEFAELIAAILKKGQSNATNATDTLRSISDKVSEFAEANKGQLKTQNAALNKTLFEDKSGLVPRLETIVEDENDLPAKTVIRRAKALDTLLARAFQEGDEGKKKVASALRKALRRTDVTDELAKLAGHITPLVGPLEPKIHIVGAWYGHLGRPWSRGVQCSATNAMTARCERKASCSAEAIAGGSLIDPVKLCGLNPAPYARGLARGLAVEYTCETGDDAFWDELRTHPAVHSGTKKPRYGPKDTQKVVLRSSSMNISCSFPVESDGK